MSYYLQAGVAQVLSKDFSMKLSIFAGSDDGYLTNPHGRIIRDDSISNANLT